MARGFLCGIETLANSDQAKIPHILYWPGGT
jgi:hypothetical protein